MNFTDHYLCYHILSLLFCIVTLRRVKITDYRNQFINRQKPEKHTVRLIA